MSGMVGRRRPWWRAVVRCLPLVALVALTGTLAAALQVREVRVFGTHRFPAREVERVLGAALGTPAVAARPEALRSLVRTLPWVSDAQVKISLDGVVSCTVSERVPAAVAVDGAVRRLADGEGNLLGPADGTPAALEIHGFAPYPDERADVLAHVAEIEAAWGGRLTSVARIGPRDVELAFADTACTVVADPAEPASLPIARRVLESWTSARGGAPRSLDARVPGRIAVRPALPPAAVTEPT